MLGLLDYQRKEERQLDEQIADGRQSIETVQRQIAERNQTAAEASGFGEDYNVSFDPSAGTITVTLANTILFSPGKARLKRTSNAELDHILSVLQEKYAGRGIDVIGHTDSDYIKKSKWKDNWELSAQRSLSVVRYMVAHGMAEDRIRQVGCGASRPIASNATAGGKARNRRVEIVVYMR